jgi:hypothetical protein
MVRALKCQLLLIVITYWGPIYSSGFQIGAGGITPHYSLKPGYHSFCNQYGHSNVIHNGTYYLRGEGNRDAFTAMVGQDSICSPIQGLFYTYKIYEGKWFGFALTAGGYHFNMKNWNIHEDNTPDNVISPTPVYTKIRGYYLVPIVAPEFNLGLVHEGSWSLNLNAIVAPIISNLSLSLKKRF